MTSIIMSIAALVGSQMFQRNIAKLSSLDNQNVEQDNCEPPKIKFSNIEILLYEKLLLSLNDNDNMLSFYDLSSIIYRIKTFYLNVDLIYAKIGKAHNPSIIRQFLFERIKNALTEKKINNVLLPAFNKLEKIRAYVDFCLIDTDVDNLLLYYINEKKHNREKDYTKDELKEIFEKPFKPILNAKNNKMCQQQDCYTIDIPSYYELLGKCGDLTKALTKLYCEFGLLSDPNSYSHEIVYDIANIILENTEFYFTRFLSPKAFAADITRHNINFIHHDQPNINDEELFDDFFHKLLNNYFYNRPIRNYYYFLTMASRLRQAILKNKEALLSTNRIKLMENQSFESFVKNKILSVLLNMNYFYLQGMNEEQLWSDILMTPAENLNLNN